MNNKIKDVEIKIHTYYFFDDIINTKNSVADKIKIDERSYKNILIYYIGYVTTKDLKYVKIKSVNPLYLAINKVNSYFEETNKSKYLTLVPTNKSKEKVKKYEELWSKIRDLFRSITKKFDDYDEKHMKVKFISDDDQLPLNKVIGIPSMIIVARDVFHENTIYYSQRFLDECL